MAQHPPGPYLTVGEGYVYVLNRFGENRFTAVVQAGFDDDDKRTSKDEAQAIATLFAAAPDLLAALKDAIEQLECSGYCHDHPGLALGRAAIAKAESQS